MGTQLPACVAHVRCDRFDDILPSERADLFPRDRCVTDFQLRGAARRLGRQSTPDVGRGRQLQVMRDFVRCLLIGCFAVRQCAKAPAERPPDRHCLNPPR